MVRDESDQTETSHSTTELDVVELSLQLFFWLEVQKRLWVCVLFLSTFTFWYLLKLSNHVYELPITIVYQFY
jgi:hypothetical protein